MKRRVIIDVVILCLIGLIPLLWFPHNSVLLGHDSGLSLDSITHFQDRIHYVWTQRFNIGDDQNGELLGAFFIHGFEALPAYFGFNLHWGQLIQFIFWFTLPGLAMYYVAYKMFSDKKYLPLIASVIYMLNFYILQGWFIAERTKFSIYIAFPFILYFSIRYLTGRMKFLKAVVLSGIVLGIFNGGGSIPLYGGLAFGILCVFLYINGINADFVTIRRTIYYSLGVGLMYILLNAYWLIPYYLYIRNFFNRDLSQAGGTEGALAWAKYLSSQSSFTNIFRGQGIPDWYLNPYHAYSQSFLSNPLLIGISFLFPILAFTSLLVLKTRREAFTAYLLILICLVGILFSAGPDSQFGFVYSFLVTYVPGFAIFRSAFFKFNYMVWFSYGLLIGITLDYLLTKIEQTFFKKHVWLFSKTALVIFIISYVLYHFPVLNGSFLNYSREPGKELTTRVTVPDYIFEFGKWINQQNPNLRFLVMPQLENTSYISYTWHYWSIAPITSLLSRNSFVHNTALVPENEKKLINEMYAAFLRGDMQSFSDFIDVFAIDDIVVQNDYDWKNHSWGTINPAIYESVLTSHPDLFIHERTFGKWDVYKIAARTKSLRINSSTKLSYLQGSLGKVVSFPYFAPKSPLFMSDSENNNTLYYAQNATDLYLAPECIQCDLEYKGESFQYYNPKLLPGSTLYQIVKYQEAKVKAASHDFMSLVNFYVTASDRRIIEVKWMVDTKKRLDKVLPNIALYKATLQELAQVLEKGDQNAVNESNAAQKVMLHITQQVNLIDSVYNESIVDIDQREALVDVYDEILHVVHLAREKMWVTEDIVNKKYIYNLPLKGEYGIYVKRGSLTNPENDPKDSIITFRNLPNVLKPFSTIGDWLYFGTMNLTGSKTYINFKDGTLANLIDSTQPSFLDGKDGITQDKNNFIFTTDSINKCFYYQFHNVEYLNTQYIVSFIYRNFSDKNTLSFFHQAEGDSVHRYSIKDSALTSTRYFSKFTKLITPKDGNVRLNFCNGYLSINEMASFTKQLDPDPLPEGKDLIEIRDIAFSKVAYPNIVLYKKQKDVTDVNTVESFTKKDPVTYTIHLKNTSQPVSLMMRESYGKYWRLCDQKNTCLSFDDKSHFVNAGFANAWYLKDEKLGDIVTLYYYPQRWYVLGTIITFAAIGAIILGWICTRVLLKR